MIADSVTLELSHTDVWATFRGADSLLSSVEADLQRRLEAQGERLYRSARPWFHDAGYLKVLAGLLPLVWPDYPLPRAWGEPLELLEHRLGTLERAGWRSYQLEAVRAAALAPLGRASISVATGGGKTRIAWGLAFVCGGTWRYVVYGKDPLRQAQAEFAEFRRRVAVPAGFNLTCHPWSKLPPDGVGVLVDEGHQAAAKSRARKLYAGRWLWRVALSGSLLDRMDALNSLTVGFFGPPVYTISVKDLTAQGHLAPGRVRIIRDL